jgi:hypothetical protein
LDLTAKNEIPVKTMKTGLPRTVAPLNSRCRTSQAAGSSFLEIMSVAKRNLPLSKVYRLIEPGPVVLVSTMCGRRVNIMTMSWHMMVDFEPPILACVMSNWDYSFDALKKTRECVFSTSSDNTC